MARTIPQVTDHAPWSPRIWFSSVVYRDRMWVLGDWPNNPSRNWRDVWHSRDGREWTQLRSNVVWKERHEHSAHVFGDKIWVAGGHGLDGSPPSILKSRSSPGPLAK